jgi:hypothetical protein
MARAIKQLFIEKTYIIKFNLFLSLLLLSLFILMPQSYSKDSIQKLGVWKNPPIVEMCSSSPVKISQIQVGIGWWKMLGYEIGEIKIEKSGSPCDTGNVGGHIIISLSDKIDVATTYLMVGDDGKIGWAKILLPTNAKERVLEHEIGHALGLNHNKILGHIMNESYENGGWDAESIRIGAKPESIKSFPGARAPRRGGISD